MKVGCFNISCPESNECAAQERDIGTSGHMISKAVLKGHMISKVVVACLHLVLFYVCCGCLVWWVQQIRMVKLTGLVCVAEVCWIKLSSAWHLFLSISELVLRAVASENSRL